MHLILGRSQDTAQAPATHACPEGHALPQPPQCEASVAVSTQVPLHLVCPVGHGLVHVPPSQVCPVAHAFPQLPQFLASTLVSTHSVPHLVEVAEHVQTPALQV